MRRGWNGNWVAAMAGMGLLLVAPAGCRKAEEGLEEGGGAPEVAGGNAVHPGSRVDSLAAGQGEPSKRSRVAGRTPDGRAAPKKELKVGIPVPGKPGFVFNPWTNGMVDVRGIPPGTLVRDPLDPDREHKFRTPKKAVPAKGKAEEGNE